MCLAASFFSATLRIFGTTMLSAISPLRCNHPIFLILKLFKERNRLIYPKLKIFSDNNNTGLDCFYASYVFLPTAIFLSE